MTGRREVETSSGRFGPQTAHVEAFINAIRDLTGAEAENINRAWSTEWEGLRGAAWSAEWDAAWDAVYALAVADRAGHHGLTRERLDALVGPCRTVPRLAAIIDAALADIGEVAS